MKALYDAVEVWRSVLESEEITRTLITAGAGLLGALLGALIGFVGSYIATSRALKDARKQTRYTQAHTRRSETLGTIYSMLWDIRDGNYTKLRRVLFCPEMVRDLSPEQSNKLISQHFRKNLVLLGEFRSYRRANCFYLPKDIAEELRSMFVSLEKLYVGMKREWEAQPELERHPPEKSLKAANAWFDNEFPKHMDSLRHKINTVLATDEEPIPVEEPSSELDNTPLLRLDDEVR